MKQDKDQQAAHDEKLVPLDDRVKIGKSNLRMDPSITQREETYQVILDIIKNTLCYNAFLISADVPEIYMQQFWLTIKKVKKSSFYQFDIDNKTCQIDVEIFLEILDIFPKMNQPWRTFGAIINKCLSRKTLSNDRLRPSRIGILWGIYHIANVDYAALILEDFQYQIDNFDDDEMLDRLKFINKGDIYKVNGKPIPDTWITNEIKKSEAYKMYFKYSTGLIPPKKGRGRGAQGTKATDAPKQTNVVRKKTNDASKKKQPKRKLVLHDESDESKGEPENRPTGRKKRTPRVVVIQEPPSVPIKETKMSSGKLKGAGLRPKVPNELTQKSADSNKGAGTSPEGSTDDDENLLAYKDEKPEDIPWQSTDDDVSENDDDDDAKSIDIKKTDDERMETDVEDQDDEELKAREEQKRDDQVGDEQLVIPASTTQRETPSLLQSTSSHSVSFNFDVPNIQQEPFHAVKVSVILETTQQPPSTPPAPPLPAIQNSIYSIILASIKSQGPLVVKDYLGLSLPDAFQKSVQAHVINEVKKFLSKFLPKAVKEALEKTSLSLGLSSSQDRGDAQDEDPSARSNQGKKTKKRRFNESESSKKTPTTKESSKGKSPANTSKFGKSVTAEEPVEEPIFEKASNDVEQTFDDKIDIADETQADVVPKILKKDWFKDSPKPKVFNPDWNTVKIIDDAPEQLWFNEMKLYKFKEGGFSDLHLNDIEDMLLLIAQNKLFNLDGDVIVDFVTALKMFTRGIIVKNRVEDVQLGVESYQRKLNLTKPQRTCQHFSVKEPYTLNYNPSRIIYEDKNKKKRLMRADEVHKFCDETL
ncbi:hypothetical protein Tco_1002917 [Tanacetum coccineum]|uniref:Uncharacterized protein n=1 Tax=Tanacetum coccineum TaxID=301880 RepID=A0ABQ5F891_9ASTR